MYKYIASLLLFSFVNLLFASDLQFNLCQSIKTPIKSFNLCQKLDSSLFKLCDTPVTPTTDPFDTKNKKEDVKPEVIKKEPKTDLDTFSKNSYNKQLGTVWRETRLNDGLIWWWDGQLQIYWRYLRPNENPDTLVVERMAGQSTATPFCST